MKYNNEFGEQETEQKMDSCVASVQQLNKLDMDSSDISKHPLSPASVNKSLVTSLKRKNEFGEHEEQKQESKKTASCVASVQQLNKLDMDSSDISKHPLSPASVNKSLVTSLKRKNEFGEHEEQKQESKKTASCVASVQQLNKLDMDSSDISKHPLSPASVNKSLVTSLKRKNEFGEHEEQKQESKKRKVRDWFFSHLIQEK